ncbi:ABC transporter ATP-binding protein [Bacillus tianshenii]|nr:ABC transporter ATP-binding protein [Bacillus tianshenii]
MKPIVQLKDVTKHIGNKTIIDHISLDIYRGEVFGFLGPNGAGKTTTIRMLVGLMSISEGEVLINGYSVRKNFEKAVSHVGGIIENPEMYKFLSGYDNLVHYARMIPNVKKERIDEVVRLVGLEERIKDKVKTYSLGMRQRLGLAQALLHSPSLLILDEPTNGLDPAGIREIRTYIRRLAKEEKIAVFVSSHLLAEMQLMCDRIGIIQQGKLINVETVSDFVSNDKALSVHFEVANVENAEKQFKDAFPELKATVINRKLVIEVARDEIPAIVAHFVKNGHKIYSIVSEQQTLEDKFLEMTGGEAHV